MKIINLWTEQSISKKIIIKNVKIINKNIMKLSAHPLNFLTLSWFNSKNKLFGYIYIFNKDSI